MSIVKRFQEVHRQVQRLANSRAVRIVAVSKTQPADAIVELHTSPEKHVHFGENYVQELLQKSETLKEYKDIQWHFIGHLQSNKVSSLVKGVPNLWCVETVDRPKIAIALNKYIVSSIEEGFRKDPLQVMIQVNTSGEQQKFGTDEEKVIELATLIRDECPGLRLLGLMTIGSLAHSHSEDSNPDFIRLRECRKTLCQHLHVEEDAIELSMGMSSDFEDAIRQGSTNVRVGSTIFGERKYPVNPW